MMFVLVIGDKVVGHCSILKLDGWVAVCILGGFSGPGALPKV